MNYPEPLAGLIPRGSEMELAAGRPEESLRAALARFDLTAAIAPRKLADRSLADACRAGLWLGHHFLDESHQISQNIETPTGSFWHAIMHRREGDIGNAGYWFRRVGDHAIYVPLKAAASEIIAAAGAIDDPAMTRFSQARQWDPLAFVDLVRGAVTQETSSAAAKICRQIARQEWELLLDYCYRGAVGSAA